MEKRKVDYSGECYFMANGHIGYDHIQENMSVCTSNHLHQ